MINKLQEAYDNLPIQKLREAEQIIGSLVVNDEDYNIFDLIERIEKEDYFNSLIEKFKEMKNETT